MWLLRRPSVDGTYASALTAAINVAYAAAERSADSCAIHSTDGRSVRGANVRSLVATVVYAHVHAIGITD